MLRGGGKYKKAIGYECVGAKITLFWGKQHLNESDDVNTLGGCRKADVFIKKMSILKS
jgi:hypothetical protein